MYYFVCSHANLHVRVFLFIFAVIIHSSHSNGTDHHHHQNYDISLKKLIFRANFVILGVGVKTYCWVIDSTGYPKELLRVGGFLSGPDA